MKSDAEKLCEALIKIELLKSKNSSLEQENSWLKRQIFGQKSEKIELDPEASQTMLNLFDEPVEIPALKNTETNSISTDPIPQTEESSKKKRRVIPDSLPSEDIVITPDESELTCTCCGKAMKEIGREEAKSLEYVPAHFKVIKRIRPKFGCSCGQGGIVIAETPSRPIEKSIAESSLLSHIAVSKYVDHLPLYRQSQIFNRYDIAIPRSTMDSWLGKTHHLLAPLHERMRAVMLTSNYLQMDETTIKVQKDPGVDKSKKKCHLGYFWPITDGEQVVFEYDPGRGKQVPLDLLADFHGYLQTDGYEGYRAVVEKNGIRRLVCWAHVRRKFFDAKEYNDSAKLFLTEIGKLYEIERKAEEVCETFEDRTAFRQKNSLPVLDSIWQLLDLHVSKVTPKSPMGKAVNYALKFWNYLTVYVEDGRLRIDNNRIENLIRPVALGRKNWLFAGSPEGARRAALFYSLFGSCRIRGINPFEYLTDVLNRINDTKMSELDQLLPMNWISSRM
ncbi:MAG: IS66 family transposase [Proteobacteria bacterium]|nr:IS66 family transposase [Pseudomonadota bacterium]